MIPGESRCACLCRLAFVYAKFVKRPRASETSGSKRRSFRGAERHEYLAKHLETLSEEEHAQLLAELEVGARSSGALLWWPSSPQTRLLTITLILRGTKMQSCRGWTWAMSSASSRPASRR